MARIQPLRSERLEKPERVDTERARRELRTMAGSELHVGPADVHIDTPSHTPGTRKGEEVIQRSPEKGRPGHAREARSSTSINPGRRGPIDPRMPHLPPA